MAEITINPLSVDFGTRFDEKEIPNFELRNGLNSVNRKLRAIKAISIILQADHTERTSQDEPLCLHQVQAAGLFDALIELSDDGTIQSEQVGLSIIKLGKGKRHG